LTLKFNKNCKLSRLAKRSVKVQELHWLVCTDFNFNSRFSICNYTNQEFVIVKALPKRMELA